MRDRYLRERASALVGVLVAFLTITLTVATAAGALRTRPIAEVRAALAQATHSPVAGAQSAVARPLQAARRAPAPLEASAAAPAAPPLTYQVAGNRTLLQVSSQAGILVDLDTKQVLWSQNLHQRRATASLAKIFTVMVALDHASMGTLVTVPPGGEDDNPGHSVMGLSVGDKVNVRDLVNGIWLASGDDAAETLARTLIPRQRFIDEMNLKARFLGLRDTHFSNPSGLDDPGEFSSPYDLAIAAGWVELHYPEALALAGQRAVRLPAGPWHRDLSMMSLNRMLHDFPAVGRVFPRGYIGATGLKTGYTENAGGCVVATATRGGHRMIAVVMDSDFFFTDAGTVLDYGWTQLPR